MLGLAGFALDSIEEVRRASFGGQSSVDESKLNNTVSREGAFVSSAVTQGLQRVADIPIYFCDPLVRRSSSLQATKDASEPVVG
jgi:NADH-quinone oxidoreductase subunit G